MLKTPVWKKQASSGRDHRVLKVPVWKKRASSGRDAYDAAARDRVENVPGWKKQASSGRDAYDAAARYRVQNVPGWKKQASSGRDAACGFPSIGRPFFPDRCFQQRVPASCPLEKEFIARAVKYTFVIERAFTLEE
jgi:hypothetical protein